MFKLFIILSFLAITFTSSKYIKKKDKLNCPFVFPTGEPCKRSREFRQKIAEGKVEKNIRPDILPSNMTGIQRRQDNLCCYETACLKECGNYLRTLDEKVWPIFLARSDSLAWLNSDFFKNYIPLALMDDDVDQKSLVEQWQIRVTHFFLNKNDLNMASRMIGYLPDKH